MRALERRRPTPVAEGPLWLTEPDEPSPCPGELLLRVAACAA